MVWEDSGLSPHNLVKLSEEVNFEKIYFSLSCLNIYYTIFHLYGLNVFDFPCKFKYVIFVTCIS